MKRFITFFAFMLVSWSDSFAEVSKQEKIFLELAWKHQFQFAGYYMAKEKGFYADANLDVTIEERRDSDMPASMTDARPDGKYGIGHSSLVVEIANGKKLKMLFAAFQSSPSVFVALKDSNITNVADFKDKRIMVTQDMATTLSLQAILLKKGLTLDDMELQEHSFTPQSLLDKKTDIMASYISNEPYFLKSRGVDFVVFDPAQEGFDFYSDILYTSQKEHELHGDRTAAFTKASIKGWEYAFAHMEESVELIFKKYNTQNKSKEELLYEARSLKQLAYVNATAFGTIEIQKLQRIYDLYNVMGFVSSKVDLGEFFLEQDTLSLSPKEKEYLKKRAEIKMCVDPNWMPYEKIENGKHIGMSADYFSLLEKMLGTKIELVQTRHWDESVKFAKARKCDILSLAMPTKEREKHFRFTKPYIDVSFVLATKSKVPFMDDFKLLKDKKIGVTKGFTLIEVLKEKYPNLKLVVVENSKEGLVRVVNGELFGYIGGLADISYYFQKDLGADLKISGKLENIWSHSIGVRNDDAMLLSVFEKALASISADQRQEIKNRWISIHYDEQKDYRMLWWAVGVMSFGLSIALIFLIKQRQINEIIKAQAARDYMTGLYNRRYFTTRAESLFDLAKRNQKEMAAVMVDIDDFKKINDTYGHQVGDEVIIAVATLMKQTIRKSDIMARWGGEEFLILLPETQISGAQTIAEKIRSSIETMFIEDFSAQKVSFTLSLGVSKVRIVEDTRLDQVISRADAALYEAKKNGKNRVFTIVE